MHERIPESQTIAGAFAFRTRIRKIRELLQNGIENVPWSVTRKRRRRQERES